MRGTLIYLFINFIFFFSGGNSSESSEVQNLKLRNQKLQEQVKENRAKCKELDSQLKTSKLELVEKEKFRCESEEKCVQLEARMGDLLKRNEEDLLGLRQNLTEKDIEIKVMLPRNKSIKNSTESLEKY